MSDKPVIAPARVLARRLHEELEKEVERIADSNMQAMLKKMIEQGKAGNVAAMRLCLKHLRGERRGVPVKCELPPLRTAADVLTAMQIVSDSVAIGKLTTAEAGDLAKVFDVFLHALGHIDLEKRVKAMEDVALPKTRPE